MNPSDTEKMPIAVLSRENSILRQRVAEFEAEHRHANEAARAGERLYRAFFEQAAFGVAEVETTTGRFLRINQRFCDILGYAREELEQLHFQTITDPDDLPADLENFRLFLAGNLTAFTREKRYRRKDGGRVWVYLTVSRMWADGEAPSTHIAVVKDITERKQADIERLAQQEQIARTQKLESLATLARGIAHDFNNLLGSFFGNVGLARDCLETHELQAAGSFLDQSLKTLTRARGLTEQLVTFAKGGEPVMVPIELGKFVRETVRFSLSGSKLRCEVAVAPDLWPCKIDQTQVGQVIDNLAINARQAMSEGGELRVDVRNVEVIPGEALPLSAGRYLRVTVADNGPGISAEDVSRIFDPFFSTKAGNSGLGLATSYSIVRRHGGHIAVESKPGQGATFRIYLPADVSGSAAASSEFPRVAPLFGRRVLIMDDEPAVREIMTAVLSRRGAEVTSEAGGDATVAAFVAARNEKQAYDVAILDLTIPGEPGGGDVLLRLRNIDPSLRAIATSGYSDDPVMARPTDFGFKVSLRKPHTRKELEAALEAALA